jgi:hypothetical protein
MDFIATHSTNTLSIITEHLHAEYLYPELRIFYCYADWHYAECGYAECYYTECPSTVVTSSLPELSKTAQ